MQAYEWKKLIMIPTLCLFLQLNNKFPYFKYYSMVFHCSHFTEDYETAEMDAPEYKFQIN